MAKCRLCRIDTQYDFYVSDDDWKCVVGLDFGPMLCLDCFDKMAAMRKTQYKVNKIIYAGEGYSGEFSPEKK